MLRLKLSMDLKFRSVVGLEDIRLLDNAISHLLTMMTTCLEELLTLAANANIGKERVYLSVAYLYTIV